MQPANKTATMRPASGRRPSQGQQQLQQLQSPAEQPKQELQRDHQPAVMQPSSFAERSLEATLPVDIYMDNIIHKLRLLAYERDFCRRKKPYRKGLTPYYFVDAQRGQNGNEQFFYFTSLAVWLLRLCGIKLPTPREFDDPNSTLQGILQSVRNLGFSNPSYPPSKLMPGWGVEVCVLLDGLLDVTLERRGLVQLQKTTFNSLGREEEAVLEEDVTQDDDAADITSQAAAALLATQESSSDDTPLASMADDTRGQAVGVTSAGNEAPSSKQVLVSTVDPVAWKLEVERVAPKLRVAVAPDMRDWRQHLEAAHTHMAALSATWPAVRAQLEQLSADVSTSLDKVEGREQQLMGQFHGLMEQYRDSRQRMTDMQEELGRRTELISERNNELHRVASALEDVKQQLENRGNNLTDASPLVRLKASMSNLRDELKSMELRIGVVAHNLMSLSLQDKQSALQDAAKRRAKDNHAKN